MQTKDITLTVIFPASADKIYHAWMDSKIHSEMIAASAKIDPTIGGKFSLWDNAIVGQTIELHPKEHTIIQKWRDNSPDWDENYFSVLTVKIEDEGKSRSRLTITQKGIPSNYSESVRQGWIEYYWKPMKKYFATNE